MADWQPEPDAAAPTVLGYEQNPAPPCVVRSPGRVALLMPPPSRWVVAGCMVALAAVWVASVWKAAVVVDLLLTRGPPPRQIWPAVLFFLSAPPILTGVLAGTVWWWARSARVGAVLEVVQDEMILTVPDLFRTRRRRVPLAEVEDVEFDVAHWPAFGKRILVRVTVLFSGWRPKFQRIFHTTDASVVADAREGFAEALARHRRMK